MTELPGLSGNFDAAQGDSSSRRSKRGKAPPPFFIRLTFEERTRLEQEAGDMPLGAYIRSRVFDDRHPPIRRRKRRHHRRPSLDHQALARLLAELGRARWPTT